MEKIQTKFQLSREKLPTSGTQLNFVNLFQIEGDTRTDQSRLNDSSIRQFEIRASLSKLHDNVITEIGEIDNEDGESYFILPNNVREVNVAIPHGNFRLLKNSRNEISIIHFKCNARNHEEACKIFYSNISPMIDYLSFRYNIPVSVDRIYCFDSKNDSFLANYIVPYYPENFDPLMTKFDNELAPIFALYREAKNNNSLFYRFLCYYKILEGIYRHFRPNLMKKVRDSNINLNTVKELLPDDDELPHSQRKYIGTTIQVIFETFLTHEYRKSVAHYFTDENEILNVSDYQTQKDLMKFFSYVRFVAEFQLILISII